MKTTKFIVDGFDKETNEKISRKIIEQAFPIKSSGYKKLEELLKNTKNEKEGK